MSVIPSMDPEHSNFSNGSLLLDRSKPMLRTSGLFSGYANHWESSNALSFGLSKSNGSVLNLNIGGHETGAS
jgi:hypothetical protein